MEHALIIGCGYTGEVLAGRLLAAKVSVTATRVQHAPLAGARVLALDLRAGPVDPATLDLAPGTVIYYMVSTLVRSNDPRRLHLRYLDNALAGLNGRRPRGLIYLSSTSVYGDQGGGWIDEQTPPAPSSPWGRMRLELEQRVRAHGQAHHLPTCVVRLPEIYGPGRGPIARLRRGYTLRYPRRYSNRIHVEDLARVLELLGRRLDPPLLLVSDDRPARSERVYDHAAQLLGMDPAPRQPGATVGDENRLALLRDSKRCDNSNLLKWLGENLKYPTYEKGLPTTM